MPGSAEEERSLRGLAAATQIERQIRPRTESVIPRAAELALPGKTARFGPGLGRVGHQRRPVQFADPQQQAVPLHGDFDELRPHPQAGRGLVHLERHGSGGVQP